MSNHRQKITKARRLVVKVGSSLLTCDSGLNTKFIKSISSEINNLIKDDRRVLLVSSGAVASGFPELGWAERPTSVIDFHVAAAVGQLGLFGSYSNHLGKHGIKPAQLLLSAAELADRSTYLNSRLIIRRLFELGILPIVNENDAIALSERRFGDNDRLASILANLIEADLLVIISDINGIYAGGNIDDPNSLLKEVVAGDSCLQDHVSNEIKSKYGSGGMAGKVSAATTAARGGIDTLIVNGREKNILSRVIAGEELGTLLRASEPKVKARKLWLSEGTAVKGDLQLDDGAVRAVCKDGRSLLPVGIIKVTGNFHRGDVVNCLTAEKKVIARGLVNYDSTEAAKLCQARSSSIEKLLGYMLDKEMIHRDNLAILS